MANNKFIDKVLINLSLANSRLQCPITRLHIQIEMQSSSVQSLIQYFLMLQPEYQYNLKNLGFLNHSSLLNISAFAQLKDYMTGQKLLYFNEADWLEAAIHDTLLDKDSD